MSCAFDPVASLQIAIAESFHGTIGSPMSALLVDGKVADGWRGLERGNDQLLAEIDEALAPAP